MTDSLPFNLNGIHPFAAFSLNDWGKPAGFGMQER
jgi:hypothetical protein